MGHAERHVLAGARILIVEDEFFLADELAGELLTEGAEVIGPAASVEMAEQLVAHSLPDCAILDINLRGVWSCDLARSLAQKGVPFLVLTGYDPSALPADLRGAPYMEKPVASSLVLDRLSAVIRSAAHPA